LKLESGDKHHNPNPIKNQMIIITIMAIL